MHTRTYFAYHTPPLPACVRRTLIYSILQRTGNFNRRTTAPARNARNAGNGRRARDGNAKIPPPPHLPLPDGYFARHAWPRRRRALYLTTRRTYLAYRTRCTRAACALHARTANRRIGQQNTGWRHAVATPPHILAYRARAATLRILSPHTCGMPNLTRYYLRVFCRFSAINGTFILCVVSWRIRTYYLSLLLGDSYQPSGGDGAHVARGRHSDSLFAHTLTYDQDVILTWRVTCLSNVCCRRSLFPSPARSFYPYLAHLVHLFAYLHLSSYTSPPTPTLDDPASTITRSTQYCPASPSYSLPPILLFSFSVTPLATLSLCPRRLAYSYAWHRGPIAATLNTHFCLDGSRTVVPLNLGVDGL